MNPPSEIFTLETLRNKIEKMPKDRHIQALNILVKYHLVTINEPKYGNVNVNLSCVPKEAVDDLMKFVSYVEDQEKSLMLAEEQKKIYQEVFFTADTEPSQSVSIGFTA
jgi:RAB protein geranylgeranyltransferase component A